MKFTISSDEELKRIADCLSENGVACEVFQDDDETYIITEQQMEGSDVTRHFTIRVSFGDMIVRAHNLVSCVPADDREEIMRICNRLNRQYRHAKFYMTPEDCVDAEYVLMICEPENNAAELARQMYGSFFKAVSVAYSELTVALSELENLEDDLIIRDGDEEELAAALREFHESYHGFREKCFESIGFSGLRGKRTDEDDDQ